MKKKKEKFELSKRKREILEQILERRKPLLDAIGRL